MNIFFRYTFIEIIWRKNRFNSTSASLVVAFLVATKTAFGMVFSGASTDAFGASIGVHSKWKVPSHVQRSY
jgi:hypothetical protein